MSWALTHQTRAKYGHGGKTGATSGFGARRSQHVEIDVDFWRQHELEGSMMAPKSELATEIAKILIAESIASTESDVADSMIQRYRTQN